ncbi:Lysine-specific demethylase JMJ27-like protein [Drosera capensis]
MELTADAIEHFQRHWIRGEPVIVRNVMDKTSGLSWEPLVLWWAFRETGAKGKLQEETRNVRALDCMDWCEVNLLTHTAKVKIAPWQVNAINRLRKEHEAEDSRELYGRSRNFKGSGGQRLKREGDQDFGKHGLSTIERKFVKPDTTGKLENESPKSFYMDQETFSAERGHLMVEVLEMVMEPRQKQILLLKESNLKSSSLAAVASHC